MVVTDFFAQWQLEQNVEKLSKLATFVIYLFVTT